MKTRKAISVAILAVSTAMTLTACKAPHTSGPSTACAIAKATGGPKPLWCSF
jgi:hypothetical protein